MEPFKKTQTIVTPLDKANVDTDQIIPKQFLKLIKKTGFGEFLFHDWMSDKNFVPNDIQYKDSKILIAGDNFGCGSSRERAVWALCEYGFSVIVAPTFADIFYNNCFKNGLLAIRLDQKLVNHLKEYTGVVTVDLKSQTITTNSTIPFQIEPYRRKILLEGLDEITLTLKYEDKISKFEETSTVPSVL